MTGKVCPEGASSGACDRKAAESPRTGSPLLERSRELGEGLRGLSANAASAHSNTVAPTPVDKWMIGRGKGHAVVHQYHH
ncbi:hypothetical protein ABT218_30040 [Streptomyces sp. NPDC001455]|uniref:hypothetical protein n=1 Tax=unclassified Streptomyces TaxID=2593676 RepID=UPI00331A27EB